MSVKFLIVLDVVKNILEDVMDVKGVYTTSIIINIDILVKT